MKFGINRKLKLALALAMGAVALLGTGCAIHSQAPIKEVAYDFSDADFYDRGYAASPRYLSGQDETQLEADEGREALAEAESPAAATAASIGFIGSLR